MKLQSSERNRAIQLIKKTTKSIYILGMLVLFACSNDMATVSSISEEEEMPVDIAKDVQITYSDSGNIKMRLNSELMKTYEGEEPYMEMPEGLYVRFYDSSGNIKSTLTSNYAISHE